MSYTPQIFNIVSPFDVAKISANQSHFSLFNVDWISLNNTTDIEADDSSSFYSEAHFSPNNNSYGISRVHYDGNTSDYYLMASIMPVAAAGTNAGGYGRGDDIAIHNGTSHYPKFQNYLAMSIAQNVDRANLKIIRVTL